VSSRQEEKEQRKRERLEREAAEKQAAQRKRLMQIIGGVVVGAAVVVGVVLAVAGGAGGDSERDTADLNAAAKKAGCVVHSFPNEGQGHVTKELKASDYKTNPPTSGDHNVTPAQDGLYATGNEPKIQNWVHTLEHGRILYQYKKDTPAPVIAALTTLFNEKAAYHSVLMQNNTEMPFEVAAVAWRHYVGCEKYTPAALDAMRAFRDVYVDTAPEQVP
jgi:hypothetical protein